MSDEAGRSDWRQIRNVVVAILIVLVILFVIGGLMTLLIQPGD